MNIFRTALVIVALAVTGGCYRYAPADRLGLVPGVELRARLTDAGVEEMRGYFGPGVLSVKGPLVSWDADGLALLTQTSIQREGFRPTFLTDTIRLLPHYMLGVDRKELDGKRTAAFTASILAGTAAIVLVTRSFGGNSENSGDSEPRDPDATVLFSVPLRIGFPW